MPRKPITPLLDERALVDMLARPASLGAAAHTRTAAAMTVLAAHDRKLDRETVYQILMDAFNLNETLRKAEMLAQVLYDLNRGELTEERCKTVITALMEEVERRREKVHRHIYLMSEMPYENDVIN
jgi:hypothetical protein